MLFFVHSQILTHTNFNLKDSPQQQATTPMQPQRLAALPGLIDAASTGGEDQVLVERGRDQCALAAHRSSNA